MSDMERILEQQTLEGEIGIVIDYKPGRVLATDVLQAAMGMIEALDQLDAALLSSVDTSLEPVSVLNDVQHSSLKMLLARALKRVPDDALGSLDWKKWVGGILVKGKHKLLQRLDADSPEIDAVLQELAVEYKNPPAGLIGYEPPKIVDVMDALGSVSKARALMNGNRVIVQTELGDIDLPDSACSVVDVLPAAAAHVETNRGTEFFKVKSPDLLGASQWTLIRGNRSVRVDMLHKRWVEAYQRREYAILPGDSLRCKFEESVSYDAHGNEIERKLSIVEVIEVMTPPAGTQVTLLP